MSKTRTGLDIRISRAVPDDLKSILALQKIAFMSEAALIGDSSIPPLTQDMTGIRDEFRHTCFLKVEIGDRIVGSVRAEVLEGTCLIKN